MNTVKITRHTHHYRRSVNGAWLSNGVTVTEREIAEDQVGAALSGAMSESITATWPDGVSVSVDFANTPVRGSGWGPFGYVTTGKGYQGREGVQLHPRLPGYGLMYYGVRELAPEVIATFEEHHF